MIRSELVKKLLPLTRGSLSASVRNGSSSQIDITKLEKEPTAIESAEVYDEEAAKREANIELSRNKSRLREGHYRLLHNQNPYPEPQLWLHGTVKYLRKIYGRYGSASGIDPSVCWPTKKELYETREYEKLACPRPVKQVMEEIKEQKKKKEEETWARQKMICEKIMKLDQWKKELDAKIAKKENEASAAKERKNRLIEEVRRHFGYKVDPKDDKFKELLEKKEKEQKKLLKEARKKEKEQKLIDKLLKKKSDSNSEPSENVEETKEK